MYWLDQKYINLVSSRLTFFSKVSSTLYKFRCPYCGDSLKNKKKTRGYIYPHNKSKDYIFHCHNCGISKTIPQFIEFLDPNLHDAYKLERLQDKGIEKYKKEESPKDEPLISNTTLPKFTKFDKLNQLKKISQLQPEHMASKYVNGRLIPSKYHSILHYCPNFFEWTNSIIPDKFNLENIKKDEARLIIPFINQNGEMFGFQGRSFKKNSTLKYITILIDETYPPIFNLNIVDFQKKFYVFEGPIDSMFINNSIATSGGNLVSNFNNLGIDKENAVIVYDNESRSKETIKKMEYAIDKGFNVCIWPEKIKEKDVNDMIMTKKDTLLKKSREIEATIFNNTFYGLSAKMKLAEWRKV